MAETWRNKYRRQIERGKKDQKYRILLTQAETAEEYRDRIAGWWDDYGATQKRFAASSLPISHSRHLLVQLRPRHGATP